MKQVRSPPASLWGEDGLWSDSVALGAPILSSTLNASLVSRAPLSRFSSSASFVGSPP